MNDATESPGWSPRRLAAVILVAIGVQAGLIYWFSDRAPLVKRRAEIRPALALAAGVPRDWLDLTAPTLFALPHPMGFSGRAWLGGYTPDFVPATGPETAQSLARPAGAVGVAFQEFLGTNRPATFAIALRPSPALAVPAVTVARSGGAGRVEVDGPLAQRGVRTTWRLPAWTNNETLQPSEVRVLVDAAGRPVSAVLLGSSGSRTADAHALEEVRRAQFGPERGSATAGDDPATGLASGRIQFFWVTQPGEGAGAGDPR